MKAARDDSDLSMPLMFNDARVVFGDAVLWTWDAIDD